MESTNPWLGPKSSASRARVGALGLHVGWISDAFANTSPEAAVGVRVDAEAH